MNFTLPTPKPGARHRILKPLRHISGAYLLQKNRACYVGSSRDLQARLRAHIPRFGGWKVRVFPDTAPILREQKIIEALLGEGIKLLNAVSARRRPRYRDAKPPPKPRYVKKGYNYRMVLVQGVAKPMSVWCRETGISVELALARIRIGWPEEQAVSKPRKSKRT
jgi:hypothetical protein